MIDFGKDARSRMRILQARIYRKMRKEHALRQVCIILVWLCPTVFIGVFILPDFFKLTARADSIRFLEEQQ